VNRGIDTGILHFEGWMKTYIFESRVSLGRYLHHFTENEVKNEPMLFSCDWQSAFRFGGPITRVFMDTLASSWDPEGVIVDSRVHMLMPGWFPCIPGWHHDDIPRTRSDGQPNYDDSSYRAKHVMALVGGTFCPTEFALGKHELPEVPTGSVIYREWHPIVDEQIRSEKLELWKAPSNRLIFFDWQSMHQGSCAVAPCWRWFIRASRKTERKPTNELRRQVQVYLEAPMDGW
jgi:hypothetical protein